MVQLLFKQDGVDVCEGDPRCRDLRQLVKGEELRVNKPTSFMTLAGSAAVSADAWN